MKIDQGLRTRVETVLAPLNKVAAGKAFPDPGSLSTAMEAVVPSKAAAACTVTVPPGTAALFTTAAVEIWMRAVHSFLVSASLTEASPIWASVSGYYSSHYSVRALAHVLGYFQLFRRRMLVHLKLECDHCICDFRRKQTRGGEHQLYWRLVKKTSTFEGDDLFTENEQDSETSDVR